MNNDSSLPPASDKLIASYRLLLAEAIGSSPRPSVVSLAQHTDDEDPVPLPLGAVYLAGLLAPTLDDPEALSAFVAALRTTYALDHLTVAQAVVFLDFCSFIGEVVTAELNAAPVTVYLDGALWTLAGGYPALWLGGPWRLVVGGTHHDAPTLEAAIALGHRLLGDQRPS